MKRAPAIGAVTTLVLVGLTVASATSADAHRPGQSTTRYTATVDQTAGLDEQGVPPGLGHRGTLHAKLHAYDKPAGVTTGSVELELQVTSTNYPSTILETGTIQLPHGMMTVQGVQNENVPNAPLAITGGTGIFTAHAGTITIADDGTLTIRLIRR